MKVIIKVNPKFYERKEAFQISCSINNEYTFHESSLYCPSFAIIIRIFF